MIRLGNSDGELHDSARMTRNCMEVLLYNTWAEGRKDTPRQKCRGIARGSFFLYNTEGKNALVWEYVSYQNKNTDGYESG